MEQHCRLCLEHCIDEGSTTILDEQFRQKLVDVFSFSVEFESHLPLMVCSKCTSQIHDFHAFSVQVSLNQERLSQHPSRLALNELFEVVKVEPVAKEPFFEAETRSDSLIDVEKCSKELENVSEPLAKDCGEEEEIEEGESGSHDQILMMRKRRRKNSVTQISEISSKVNEERQRRNNENERIQDFFKMDCEICSDNLETFGNLQAHYRRLHNATGFIRCCDKVLTRRAQLVEHLLVHEGVLRCNVCQKSYKCSRSLNLHKLKTHSKDEDRPYKCDKCYQSYPKQHLLTAHLARHVQEQCKICTKILSSSQALKVHIAQVHGQDSNQICATCGKEFRTKRAMDRHMKEHLGQNVIDKVQCHFCEKWINGKYNLKKHIRFIHIEGGQEFQCNICEQKYPNTRALIYHKQRVHVEETFECEYCDKRFKRKIYLKEHVASHTGQPLYSCNICDATFNSNGNLYAHRRNKHTAQWRASKESTITDQLPPLEVKVNI